MFGVSLSCEPSCGSVSIQRDF